LPVVLELALLEVDPVGGDLHARAELLEESVAREVTGRSPRWRAGSRWLCEDHVRLEAGGVEVGEVVGERVGSV
jgi:hypothetical protein